MSTYDDRLEALRAQAHDAENAMRELGDGEWPQGGDETRDRLFGVFAYARTVLETTDAALLSDAVYNEISTALASFAGNPAAGVANADPWGSSLLDAVGRLPAARDRDVEQAVKDAAANFQRAAQQRLNALNENLATTEKQLETFGTTIEERKTEVATAIEEQRTVLSTQIETMQTGFEARLTEYTTQMDADRAAISTLRAAQAEEFTAAQKQREQVAKEGLDGAQGEFTQFLQTAKQEVDERVTEIRRMETESAQLVGAIGLAGTAERYGEEVDEQKRVADGWRYATIVLALLAVGGVIFAAVESNPAAETFAGKLSLSLIFGGIATYAARQSAYHRHREQRARDLQLELTAFSPFIEPLNADQQEEERVIMTRKTFGKTTTTAKQEEEPGPTALSFALRRREKEADIG
jgi:hypothetical protein